MKISLITTAKNEYIKYIKKLQSKKSFRYDEKKFVLEGLRLVKDGIKNVGTVILSESMQKERFDFLNGVDVKTVSDAVFSLISETKSPQGILAVADMPNTDIATLNPENSVIVYCENISDPGNLGTIIRTADAAGCDAVVLDGGVDLYNPKTVRATMSSLFNVKICIADSSAADYLKSKGVCLVGTSPSASEMLYSEPLKPPLALVIGNEANGISEKILTKCNKCIKIPMFGAVESLNASVAAALVIYDAVMQRQNGGKYEIFSNS